MTRIISGKAGSLRLDVPQAGTRPTSDRVREAIFSALEAWNMVDGVRVLDLFAGSGALGCEAASRGATSVALVEKHPPAAQIVQRNVDRLVTALGGDSATQLTVHRQTARAFLDGAAPSLEGAADGVWDVVFVDPPYDFSQGLLAEHLAAITPFVSRDGLVMVERSTRDGEPEWPGGLVLFKERKYGETTLWWAERSDRKQDDAEGLEG